MATASTAATASSYIARVRVAVAGGPGLVLAVFKGGTRREAKARAERYVDEWVKGDPAGIPTWIEELAGR